MKKFTKFAWIGRSSRSTGRLSADPPGVQTGLYIPPHQPDKSMHNLLSNRGRGFTLIELLIGVSILAVLLSVAVPSFTQIVRRNKLAAQVNEYVTALNYARSEAYKRGLPISVCAADASLTSCPTSSFDWANGWLVFADADSNGEVATSTDILQRFPSPSSGFTFTPATSGQRYVNFRPLGAQQLDMTIKKNGCTSGPEKRRVTVAATGRISLIKSNCP